MTTARTEPDTDDGGADTSAGEGGAGGGGGELPDPDHRTYQRLSLRGPAFIVLGIAVFILVGGVVASALATSGSSRLPIDSVTLTDGTVVRLTPATTALKPVISSEPPADILGSLAVPVGSTQRSFTNTDHNETQYDRSVSFTSGLSSDQVISFFQTLLPRLGWKVTASAPDTAATTSGTIEILATKGSSDGFYWEVGAVVSPSTADGVTPFTVELFEQPDQD